MELRDKIFIVCMIISFFSLVMFSFLTYLRKKELEEIRALHKLTKRHYERCNKEMCVWSTKYDIERKFDWQLEEQKEE